MVTVCKKSPNTNKESEDEEMDGFLNRTWYLKHSQTRSNLERHVGHKDNISIYSLIFTLVFIESPMGQYKQVSVRQAFIPLSISLPGWCLHFVKCLSPWHMSHFFVCT